MKYFAVILFSIVFYSGCTECVTPPDPPPASTTLEKEVLECIASNVIFASYEDMLTTAGELESAITHLEDVRTPEALDSARASWKRAISSWMKTKAYLFGPIKYRQIDARIGTWPVSPSDINELVKGPTQFSPDELHFRDGAVKGYHVIEYLIFGDSANKVAGEITQREYDYLSALTLTLSRDIELLVTLWDKESPDNFTGNFANAGEDGSDYPSINDAYDELIGNFLFITDVLAGRILQDARFGNPVGSVPNPLVLESRFSLNTNQDLADIIRSIQNVYIGNECGGLSALVVKAGKNDVDASMKLHLDEAIAAMYDMTPWIGVAMFTNKAKIKLAIDAVRTLEGDIEAVAEIVVK